MVKKLILTTSIFFIALAITLTSCAPEESENDSVSSADAGPWIFVASGSTYAGNGVTMSTPVNVVSRYSIDGVFQKLVRDYSTSTGDSPVGMVDYDDDEIAVLVENTGGRKIEIVKKDGSGVTGTITLPVGTINTVVRQLAMALDGNFIFARTTALEKYTSAGSRITGAAAGPYVSAPAGTCATTNTNVVSVEIGPNGSVFMVHAAASTNNQTNIIASGGYFVAGDCLTAKDGATANHYPTTALYHTASGDMLIAYGNNTGAVHQIYGYDATVNSLTGDTLAYNSTSVLQGINDMIEMPDGSILASAAASTFNTIEKFTYDATSKTLTRVGTTSFIGPTLYTRSVSAIVVAD